jgi:hypothetical protein
MKQINFNLSFTCTDEQFTQQKMQEIISDQWKDELVRSAEEFGFESVEAKWDFEDLN